MDVNDNIRFREVRLIDADGQMLGVVPIEVARQKAEEADLDLVLISPNPENPVCRVMDYGKHMFEQSKREREQRKKQKTQELKEVTLKLTTEEHDLAFKTKNACRFLKEGSKVKVTIRFRGREMAYTSQAFPVLKNFAERCQEFGEIDKQPKMEGRTMSMFLAPLKVKSKA